MDASALHRALGELLPAYTGPMDDDEAGTALPADRAHIHTAGFQRRHVRGRQCCPELNGLPKVHLGTSERATACHTCRMVGFIQLVPIGVSAPNFVDFWRPLYAGDDSKYVHNINVGGTVTADNVAALMEWKAGRFREQARRYGRAVPANVFNDSRARHQLSDPDLQDQFRLICQHLQCENLARSEPIIWPIFLCHIAQPRTTPIYDVNVWRAWGHIQGWIQPRHYHEVPTKFETYLEYRAWFNGLVSTHGIAPRDLDQSLIAFGRFLVSRWAVPFR